MKHQRKITSDGRIIDIYDDVFPAYLRQHHIDFVQSSSYKLGSTSSRSHWQSDKTFFQSTYSIEDFENFQFQNEILFKKLKNYKIDVCWVLASSPLSTYYFHPDDTEDVNKLTLLYYVNDRWDRNWGGETLFANDSGECEIAIEYKPGRVVIFDSLIEHKPSPIAMQADEFRFIFVIKLGEKEIL